MPNPVDNPDLYDTITLGTVRSPGHVVLSGHDRDIGWDVQKGKGQSGASTVRTSEDPIEFTATFFLASAEDFAQWPSFQSLCFSTVKGASPKALDVYHPALAEIEIGSVVLKTMGGAVHDDEGGQTIAVKFLEYKPPKPKRSGSPKGSKSKAANPSSRGGAGGIDPNDPNAAALRELEALTKKYEETPWG